VCYALTLLPPAPSPRPQALLRSVLLDKYSINSTRVAHNKAKEQYRIRIGKDSLPALQSLVGNISLLQCDTVLGFKGLKPGFRPL
jgi:hypothetical protein